GLEGTFAAIESCGELTDDLSLVRVAYLSQTEAKRVRSVSIPEIETWVNQGRQLIAEKKNDDAIALLDRAYERDSEHIAMLRELIRALVVSKLYERATAVVEKYLALRPYDSHALYIAAYCFKKIGEYSKALDYGDRLNLRDPDNFHNLVNLGEVHF